MIDLALPVLLALSEHLELANVPSGWQAIGRHGGAAPADGELETCQARCASVTQHACTVANDFLGAMQPVLSVAVLPHLFRPGAKSERHQLSSLHMWRSLE